MKTKVAILLLAAITMAGCSTGTVNSVQNAPTTGRRNVIADKRIITDRGLNRSVSVVAVNTAMTPGNLLRVQVELLNRTASLQPFIYRFEWFDLNGMQINNVLSATIPDQIEGGDTKLISSVAPTPDCKDFRLKLMRAQ